MDDQDPSPLPAASGSSARPGSRPVLGERAGAQSGVTARVFFHHSLPLHPLYREQVRHLPPGWSSNLDRGNLANPYQDGGAAGWGRSGQRRSGAWLRAALRRACLAAGVVPVRDLPEAARSWDVVHSFQKFLRTGGRPWVLDFEHVSAPAFFRDYTPAGARRLRRILADPALRAILPWTEAAAGSLREVAGDWYPQVAAKVRVVYPAARPLVAEPRRLGPPPHRVVHVGGTAAKGVYESFLAVEALRRGGLQAELHAVVRNPAAAFFDRFRERPGFVIHAGYLPDELVDGLYASADLLLFPSHWDTLGFTVLNGFQRAVPAVTSDCFALPELLSPPERGLLATGAPSVFKGFRYGFDLHDSRRKAEFQRLLAEPDPAYVDALAAAAAVLLGNAARYHEASARCLAAVSEGPFSPARRAQALAEVWSACCR